MKRLVIEFLESRFVAFAFRTVFYLLSLFSFVNTAYGQKVPVMKKIESGNKIHIDFYSAYNNKAPVLYSSQFVDDIEFIPLETTDECLIGESIRNIVITKSNIVIFDYEGCYRFDRKGKFLNKIGKKGNGPGEYTKPMSIVVDTLNSWGYFSDNWSGRFMKYDFEGNSLEELKIDGMGSFNTLYKPFEFVIESSFYQYAPKGERFSFMYYSEKNKKVISKMSCDYEKDIPKLALCFPISYMYSNNLYLKDFWCDTVYKMKDPFNLKSYAVIDKGHFEDRKYDHTALITGKEEARDRMVLDISRMSETNRYIMICSNKGNLIYDKKKNNTFMGDFKENKWAVENDLYGSPGIVGSSFLSCVNGNELYSYAHSFEFIKSLKNKHLF